jgi:mono/diheme cytochrome c family protein
MAEPPKSDRGLGVLRRVPWISLFFLLVIWVGLPQVPEGTGLKFGLGYQSLFTFMVVLTFLMFWLLELDDFPLPHSTGVLMGSVTAVILVTVGLLVAGGVVYPQFELPKALAEVDLEPAERGEDLFRNLSPSPCVQCHVVEGIRGGIRGPDLTHVAASAGERVPGLTAIEYLTQKLNAGMTYDYKVPGYTPMMPPFGAFLPEEQIDDLVAFLLTLE